MGFFLAFYSSSSAQESDKKNYQVACIGFYNIENLFDTINDPNVNDEDFLPEGSYKWTGKRYWEKLDHMSYVLDELCKEYTSDGPAIMGFCEVENRAVVQDLIIWTISNQSGEIFLCNLISYLEIFLLID